MRPAAIVAVLAAFAVLAGCRQEPEFDERFEAAEKRIDAEAAALERELADPPPEPPPAPQRRAR